MKSEFSEFSYGFALTHEITRLYCPSSLAAPVFPSQVAEGRVGGGYDVKIASIPIYIQFKLSDRLTTRNAIDHLILDLPYFRFGIWASKYSKQHDLMLALENDGKSVFYAAPKFSSIVHLNEAFLRDSVCEDSAWVAPGDIGEIPDDKAHSVSFNDTLDWGIFRSTPSKLKILSFSDVVKSCFAEERFISPDMENKTFHDYLEKMAATYSSVYPENKKLAYAVVEKLSNVDDSYAALRTFSLNFFNCDIAMLRVVGKNA